MSNAEKDFLAEIKKHLDESVANLGGATRSHLSRIRSEAIELQSRKPIRLRNWLWAGSTALPALALGIFIYLGLPNQQINAPQSSQVTTVQPEHTDPPLELAATSPASSDIDPDELGILMSEGDLEMLTDLDFLTWLSSDDEVGG